MAGMLITRSGLRGGVVLLLGPPEEALGAPWGGVWVS
jgi:hypothetical protein